MLNCYCRALAGWALLASPLPFLTSCQTRPTATVEAAPVPPGDPALSEHGQEQIQRAGIPVVLPGYLPGGFHFSTLTANQTKALKEYQITYTRGDPAATLIVQGSSSTMQPRPPTTTEKSVYINSLAQSVTLPSLREGAVGDFETSPATLRVGSAKPNYYWVTARDMEISDVEKVVASLRVSPQAMTTSPDTATMPIPPLTPATPVKPKTQRPNEVIMAPPPTVGGMN